VRGIVPRVPSRVPLDSSVPSRHGVGQLLRWVSYLLNQSVPTHRPFCDRSPVQSQRVPSHPSLSPARCGWVQAKRRRTGGDRQFPRAFLGETTCPVPVSRSRRRPTACRSVGRLWTLDFGHWTRTKASRPILLAAIRCGWVQAKRRRAWADSQFLRAFLGETTCPVPVFRSRRRPDACRSVRGLWTLDFGLPRVPSRETSPRSGRAHRDPSRGRALPPAYRQIRMPRTPSFHAPRNNSETFPRVRSFSRSPADRAAARG
jgi:hypothetical protein